VTSDNTAFPVKRDIERLLDQTAADGSGDDLDVIVQMAPSRRKQSALARAAGTALTRRRMSLTPRELLPARFEEAVSRKVRQKSASTRTLLGKATTEALALAKLQQLNTDPLGPLLKSALVQGALARMLAPRRKSARAGMEPARFWSSRAMPLRLSREDLNRLPVELPGLVQSVHINRQLKLPSLIENKPLKQEETETLCSTWGLRKVGVLSTWGAYGAYGKGTLIGLLDTGVDASHPDLKGKVKHWAEFDPFGNHVPSKPHDSDEHGTHCAGTLVGGSESGRYIGVAPDARLAAALVLDGENGGTDAQVLKGIDWALEQGVDVISLSLGGLVIDAETPPTYTQAILTCLEAGVPVVAAIGNEGHQTSGSPGNDLFAMSVGATDPEDRPAGFSGGRTQIIRESEFIDDESLPLPYAKPDLSAPGVAIYSSVPGGNWKAFSGTSMATPHVAASIALLLSATGIRHKEAGERRASLVQDLIIGSVEDLGESGQDHRFGFGRLDVLRAVDYAFAKGYEP
jgi:subtilisin family serine protease